jgi:selenocysteine lyase/cysteine desulfurase
MADAVLSGDEKHRDDMAAAAFRARYFPDLADKAYLASCSLAPPSTAVRGALARMLETMMRPELAWAAFAGIVQEARSRFAALIGAQASQIALLPNATLGAYQVASTTDWSARNGVIYPDCEFPSMAYVWMAQRARGARPAVVASGGEHQGTLDHYASRITAETHLVSVPYVDYLTGKTLPVSQITEMAHAAGARVFVDAYQALGCIPIDVSSMGCDYLIGGCMKYMLGLPGLAFLYVREMGREGFPQLTGWFGRRSPMALDGATLDFAESASRYETGTPAIPSVISACSGMELVGSVGVPRIQRHIDRLIEYVSERLIDCGESLLHVPAPGAHGAHVAVNDPHAEDTAASLSERGITASPRGGGLRFSFHYYNDVRDIDRACDALSWARRRSR